MRSVLGAANRENLDWLPSGVPGSIPHEDGLLSARTPEGGRLHYDAGYTHRIISRELRRIWEADGLRGLIDALVVRVARVLIHDFRRSISRDMARDPHKLNVRILSLREAVLCKASASPIGLRLANVVFKMDGERVVEVPIAKTFASLHRGRRIAEIGNVMSYYLRLPDEWDVFDKYESGYHVKNVDILDLNRTSQYDAAIAISTLEHVGWDEESRDPNLFYIAIRNFCGLLSPGGEGLITVPLHYNPIVDDWAFREPPSGFTFHFLAPVGPEGSWSEVDSGVASANNRSLLVAFFRAQADPCGVPSQ